MLEHCEALLADTHVPLSLAQAVLMCLESGGVLMVDQRVLDPRLERLDARKMSKVEIDARRKELAAKKIPVGTEHITERMGQLLTHRSVPRGAVPDKLVGNHEWFCVREQKQWIHEGSEK